MRFSTPILRQDAPISLPGRVSPGAPHYRASGLVLWHFCDMAGSDAEGRFQPANRTCRGDVGIDAIDPKRPKGKGTRCRGKGTTAGETSLTGYMICHSENGLRWLQE